MFWWTRLELVYIIICKNMCIIILYSCLNKEICSALKREHRFHIKINNNNNKKKNRRWLRLRRKNKETTNDRNSPQSIARAHGALITFTFSAAAAMTLLVAYYNISSTCMYNIHTYISYYYYDIIIRPILRPRHTYRFYTSI